MGLSDSFEKRYLGLLLAFTLGAALPSGCAPVQDESEASLPGSVYRLPWLDSKGNYTLQDVSLSTFRDPDRLKGDVAEIIVDPRVSGGAVVGEEPIGRWIRDGARRVPADFITLQAATIYAHFEKLTEIDRATGVARALKTPARIGLLARISEGPASPMILNNAIYDGSLDSLFIVPYSGSKLFISLNAGILGHEHFHRVFQAIILNPIREAARLGSIPYGWDESIACMGSTAADSAESKATRTAPIATADSVVTLKIFNQVLVRGLNEGLADFWGWAYSQDDEFVGRSLSAAEDAQRRMDVQSTTLPQKSTLRSNLVSRDKFGMPVLKSEEGRIAAAYQFGTQYARVLRGTVEALAPQTEPASQTEPVSKSGLDRRVAISQVRQALASSLQEVSREVLSKWGREELDPETLLKPMFVKLLMMSATGPAVLDAAGSTVVCKELARLGASENLKSGLCGGGTVPR